ncbi:MAG: hypothetical protein IJQ50_06620 [Clostridia bacterium]|nr:hypothetical protein [Clostridia bacterium]
MEKTGIYSDGGLTYSSLNDNVLLSGTHEIFVSLIKTFMRSSALNSNVLTFIYFTALILIFILIVKSASKTNYTWTTFLCAVLLPFVFCDFSNAAYFNTMYENPLILIFLLLICGLFINAYKNEKAGIVLSILLFISILAYSRINILTAVTSTILGVLFIRMSKISEIKMSKLITIVLGVVIILQSIMFIFTYKNADYKQSIYNSVFFGISKFDSVTEIGLDKSLDDFKEVYYGMKENEANYNLQENFYDKISYKDILKYYVTHPVNAFKLFNSESKAAFFNDYDFPFTLYSAFKKLYIPSGFLITLVFAVVYIIVAILTGKSSKKIKYMCEFLAGIAVMWIISLITAAIYNGNCNITINTYTFNVLFDIMLVSAIVGGIRVLLNKSDENKKKYSITRE